LFAISWMPFALFCGVVGSGFLFSSLLDAWFGSGGLQRAQSFLALKDAEKQLYAVATKIAGWNKTLSALAPPAKIEKTDLWIGADLDELQKLWENWDTKPVDKLSAAASTYSLHADAANSFESRVQLAFDHYTSDPAKLGAIIANLDQVVPPATAADLATYADTLTAALTPGATTKLAAAVKIVTSQDPNSSLLIGLRKKMTSMNALHRLMVWMIVLSTAYLSFYATHTAFGSLPDYIAVFLWSFGLTTTGSQIVASVRKP